MKRRTQQARRQAEKRRRREKSGFKSRGNSKYAQKVKNGQVYGTGPAPTPGEQT